MSHFSRKFLFFAAVAVTFSSQLKPAEALRCFQCAGYDRVENQCNPEVEDGKSIECTGPHPVCELIVETYSRDSVLHGNFYYLRKCGQQPDLDDNVTVSTCAPEVPIASTLVTRCYCNTKDDCNRGLINGKGSNGDVIRVASDLNDWEFLSAKEATDSANEIDPSSPLKCWQCSGYNRIKNECGPYNRGKLVECPGLHAVCEVVAEVDTSWTYSKTHISRKCGTLANNSVATNISGNCDEPTQEKRGYDLWNITRCYCNTWNECNFGGIAGVGEPAENFNFIEGQTFKRSKVMQFYHRFMNTFRNGNMTQLLPKSCQALLKTDGNSRSFASVALVCMRNFIYEKVAYMNRLWPSTQLAAMKKYFGLN